MKYLLIIISIVLLASCSREDSIPENVDGLDLIADAQHSSAQNNKQLTELLQDDVFYAKIEGIKETIGSMQEPCTWQVPNNCTSFQGGGILTYAGCEFDFSFTVISCPGGQYFLQDVSYTVVTGCSLSGLLTSPTWATEANNLILAAFSSAMEDLNFANDPNSIYSIILPKKCTGICGSNDYECDGEGGCCTRTTVPDGSGGYIRTVGSETIECIDNCLVLSTGCSIDCEYIDSYLNGAKFSHTQ